VVVVGAGFGGATCACVSKQRAGAICAQAGVRNDTAKVWCQVDGATYESPLVPFVHVLGDSVASNMPKSAHVSNTFKKFTKGNPYKHSTCAAPDPFGGAFHPVLNSARVSFPARAWSTIGGTYPAPIRASQAACWLASSSIAQERFRHPRQLG